MAKAPTLKSVVDKVKKSKGKKKYYFAYGTGKRSDGKPYDGALKIGVGGPTKPKKVDVEAECACTQFFEGTCWSSGDGDTVFFRGKGKAVPPTTIAKMAITANRIASKQYDFQAPSAAEEERSETLPETHAEDEAGEGEDEAGEGEVTEGEVTTPPRQEPAPDLGLEALIARFNKLPDDIEDENLSALWMTVSQLLNVRHDARTAAPLLDELERGLAAAAIPAPPGIADPAAKNELVRRLNRLGPNLKLALARKGPHGPRLQELFTAASRGIEGNKLPAAGLALDALEPLIDQVLAAPVEAGDEAGRFAARLKGVLARVVEAKRAGNPDVGNLTLLASEAQALARQSDFVQANDRLDQAEKLIGPTGEELEALKQKALAALAGIDGWAATATGLTLAEDYAAAHGKLAGLVASTDALAKSDNKKAAQALEKLAGDAAGLRDRAQKGLVAAFGTAATTTHQDAATNGLTLKNRRDGLRDAVTSAAGGGDYGGARDRLGEFRTALAEAKKAQLTWQPFAADFNPTELAVAGLTGHGALEAGDLTRELEAIKKQVEDEEFAPAALAFPGLKRRAADLLALYPGRGNWQKLAGDVDTVAKQVAGLIQGKDPAAADLDRRLKAIRAQATDAAKGYDQAVRDFTPLQEAVKARHDLAAGRLAWDGAVARHKVVAGRRITELESWGDGNAGGWKTTLEGLNPTGDVPKPYLDAAAALNDLQEKVAQAHKTWTAFRAADAQFQKISRQQPDAATEMRALIGGASELLAAKEYTKVDALLKRFQAAAKTTTAQGKDVQALQQQLKRLRTAGADALGQLEAKVRAVKTAQATEAADIIKKLAADLPTEAEDKLLDLALATEDGETTRLKGEVRAAVQAWIAFLKSNAKFFEACEKNPLKVKVALTAPVEETLKLVLKQTAA
jgi:hypothetical protein